jgi:hypothetical protein
MKRMRVSTETEYFTARFARGAKFAERIIFSFAAETPANENFSATAWQKLILI